MPGASRWAIQLAPSPAVAQLAALPCCRQRCTTIKSNDLLFSGHVNVPASVNCAVILQSVGGTYDGLSNKRNTLNEKKQVSSAKGIVPQFARRETDKQSSAKSVALGRT